MEPWGDIACCLSNFYGRHDHLNRQEGRIFFLGSTEDILAEIRQRMAADYPNLRVAGTFSPPYKPEFSPAELDEMIAAINAARPDVLWVGMAASVPVKATMSVEPQGLGS